MKHSQSPIGAKGWAVMMDFTISPVSDIIESGYCRIQLSVEAALLAWMKLTLFGLELHDQKFGGLLSLFIVDLLLEPAVTGNDGLYLFALLAHGSPLLIRREHMNSQSPRDAEYGAVMGTNAKAYVRFHT
jgi:hypothetical protein